MISILVAAALSTSQGPPPVQGTVTQRPDACAIASDCRFRHAVRLTGPDGKVRTYPIQKRLPWIPEGNVMLFAGEAVIIRLDAGPDGRLRPVLVQGGEGAVKAPLADGQIRMIYTQASDRSLTLLLDNRLKEWVHYDIIVVTPTGPGKSTVCTLLPGKLNIERWQDPIVQIAASNFRVVKRADAGCR